MRYRIPDFTGQYSGIHDLGWHGDFPGAGLFNFDSGLSERLTPKLSDMDA
jgi:hypothetical protein